MAEFCLDCWNDMNETNDPPRKYIISKELSFCEGCGAWKNTIVMERQSYFMRKFRYILFPVKLIHIVENPNFTLFAL